MIIFGSVGMMSVTSLQNYFHVQGAEEKLTSALKEAKQAVLKGDSPCSRVSVFNGDQSNKKPMFFVVEEWEQIFTGDQRFCEYHQNGERVVSNLIKNIDVEEKNGDWVLVVSLKNESFTGVIYPEAFTSSYKPLEVQDDQGEVFTSGLDLSKKNEFYVPLNSSQDYFVKIFDEMQAVIITRFDVHFYNANVSMIASTDPSTIEVENIEAKTRSAQKSSGNIEVVYEAPYGKGMISLLSGQSSYKASDVVIHFINANEASGEMSFFNASILSAQDQKKKLVERSACVLESQSLELNCVK